MRLREFAHSPERNDNDDVPDQLVVLANRWWNATDRQPQIEHVLNSLGWSIHQVESEDDAVQLQHRDGTTYFISADDFDPDLFEYKDTNDDQTAHRDGLDLESIQVGRDFQVTASSHGRELAMVMFQKYGDTLIPQNLEVGEQYRGQGIAAVMYDWVKELGYKIQRSPDQSPAGKRFWDKHRGEEGMIWESQELPTEDMIAYLKQHHDTNLHQDYLDHINTFGKFVLKDIPTNTIKTELSGLDRAKVERYKKMDFDKAPPIVMGDGYILDGYHRAVAAKALGIPTIRAYVGVKKVEEGYVRKLNFDEIYGKYLKVTDNNGDPNKKGFSLVTPLNGDSWNWRERPEFKDIVKRKLNQPGWLGDHKYQQIIDAMAGNKFDPAKHLVKEIARLPKSEVGDWGDKGTLADPEHPIKTKPLPGGSKFDYAVNKTGQGDIEIMIFDGQTLAAEMDLFDTQDFMKTWRVETVVVDPDYRGQGLGKALYGIALSILRLTIEAGESQTRHGQQMWLMLNSIPGVEVVGYNMVPTDKYKPHRGDQIVKQDADWTRYTFPVESGTRSMRSRRPGTGLYNSQATMIARWTGR